MIVRTVVEICTKILISRLGGATAISVVAIATATLTLFLDVVFELNEARILKIQKLRFFGPNS